METSNLLRRKEGALSDKTLGDLDEILDLIQGEYPSNTDFFEFWIISPIDPLPEGIRSNL